MRTDAVRSPLDKPPVVPCARAARPAATTVLTIAIACACTPTKEALDPARAEQRGHALVAEGKVEAARATWARLLLEFPHQASVRLALGASYVSTEQWGRAQKELSRDLGCVQDNDQRRLMLAEVALATGRAETIAPLLAPDLLVPQSETNPRIHLLRGHATVALDQRTDAAAHFQRALQLDPSLVGPRLAQTQLHLRDGDFAASAALLDAIDPARLSATEQVEYWHLRYRVNAAQSQHQLADDALSRAIELAPRRSDLRAERVRRLLGRGVAGEASADIGRLLQSDPLDPLYLWFDGRHAQLLGNNRHALARWREALNVDPSFAPALLSAAQITHGEDPDTAADFYVRYLATAAPRQPEAAHAGLADIFFNQRKHALAERHLRWLLEHRDNPSDQVDMLQLELAWGRLDRAQKRALELSEAARAGTVPALQLLEVLTEAGWYPTAAALMNSLTPAQRHGVPVLLQARIAVETEQAQHALDLLSSRPAATGPEAALLRARALGRLGRRAEAGQVLEVQLAATPQHLPVRQALAELLRLNKQIGAARNLLAAAPRAPGDWRAEEAAALFESQIGNWSGYRRQMDDLVARFPNSTELHVRYAEGLLRAKQPELARRILTSVATDAARNPRYREVAGRAALALDDAEGAVTHLHALADLRPGSARAQALLGEAYQLSGNPLSALTAFRRAATLDPDSLMRQAQLIEAELRANAPSRALQVLRPLIERETVQPWPPMLTASLIDVVDYLEHTEQAPRGRQLLEDALNKAPRDTDLWARLCSLALAAGSLDRAQSALVQVQELEPHGARTLLLQGLLTEAQGNPQAAQALYRSALTQRPLAGANLALIDSLDAGGHQAEALQQAQSWAVGHPEDLQNLSRMAELSTALGNTEAALQALERLLALAPSQHSVLVRLTRTAAPEDPALALGYAKQAYLLKPSDPEVAGLYGELLLRLKRSPDQAQALLLQAFEGAPGDAHLQLQLAQAELALGNRVAAIRHLRALMQTESAEGTKAKHIFQSLQAAPT